MPLSSRILPPAIVALSAAAFVSLPGAAHAANNISIAPGLSLGVSFGQKVSFSVGADLRVTFLTTGQYVSCPGGAPRSGVGAFAQAAWLSAGAGRFAAGFHAGGELIPSVYALDGEVGWTYHTRYDQVHPAQHGVHLGALNTFVPVLVDMALRIAAPLSEGPGSAEGTLGLGLHYPTPFGLSSTCIDNRIPPP